MRTAPRLPVLVAVLAVLTTVAGCGVFGGGGPQEAAEAYAAAWSAGDVAGAAALTDDPAAAGELLGATRAALQPQSVVARVEQVREGDEQAAVSITQTWELGAGRSWSYRGELELRPSGPDGEWRVRWAPAVVHPQLGPDEELSLRTDTAEPAPVLDRSGAPLLEPTPVVSVLLDRRAAGDLPAVAGALARALSPIDRAITQQSIVDGAARAPDGQAHTVAVLRETDYRSVQDAIYDLPGVRFTRATRLLAPDADFARQVLPAIRTEVAAQLDGVPGWSVVADGGGGPAETLVEEAPRPGSPVTVELDRALQAAAEDAVETEGRQAILVALQPATGAVLAVAQNDAADTAGPVALTGRYPPGSTFKIVTATAGIEAAGLRTSTPVHCPAETTVNGRVIPNADRFDLGTAPLTAAFARSCNTTFAQLAVGLEPGALPAAARSLGLGADFAIPGLPTVTGDVPAAQDELQRAVNGIGQGDVLASPFGMALVAATAANGAPVVPQLYRDRPTEVLSAATPPDPVAIDQLRPMMRAVVTDGTASALAGVAGLHGKTGTAEFGAGGADAHGWFVGYRGDVAFAALVVDGGSSAPAIAVAQRFLTATQG